METPGPAVVIPAPTCSRDLIEVLTTVEGIICGLILCGDDVCFSVRGRSYDKGLPVLSYNQPLHIGVKQVWWVANSETLESAFLTTGGRRTLRMYGSTKVSRKKHHCMSVSPVSHITMENCNLLLGRLEIVLIGIMCSRSHKSPFAQQLSLFLKLLRRGELRR